MTEDAASTPANVRVGLTGGMGAGKSSVAARLREHGALVVDADAIAREVVAPGSAGLAAIVERFGDDVLRADGSLDRAALGAKAFADDAARRDLEAITHPRIAARTVELMGQAAPGQVIVHDIPLLVELHREGDYDLVVVVDAPVDVRVQRLADHRSIPEDVARQRIAAQATAEQRRAVADVWIDNTGDADALKAAVDAAWNERIVPLVRSREESSEA